MTRTTPRLASPLQTSAPCRRGDVATAYDLAYSGPHARRIFSEIGFRAWSPSAPRAEALPLGYRALRFLLQQQKELMLIGLQVDVDLPLFVTSFNCVVSPRELS
ncbi:hypothetical protein AVEN_11554-1 [Araneus ventricosus]|uniref:Uncharacterized protein n=1 Tax=Araneus ventricosus TaxID=182803 RepID=A0A4Y2X0P4_ARAVE|nr:hypothetical protein AVEN_11554-1 [Araneus ventricosus]